MDINAFDRNRLTLGQKISQIRWVFLLLLTLIAGAGAAMLYSAANGDWQPWAIRHIIRFVVALGVLLVVALTDVRFWIRHAYTLYLATLVLLIGVEVMGSVGMGAQRWISIGGFQIQPSELMKLALILALARYFHGVAADAMGRLSTLLFPAILIGLPALMVLRQPDLGTAVMLVAGGAMVLFAAGVRWWVFVSAAATVAAAMPIAWQFLHDYQRERVLTFLDPGRDPLGAGYHILQSKIALGAGGMFGKGFLDGSQSHLNFLPEKQTDFIFTMFAEEFGLFGALSLLFAYGLVLCYCFAFALSAKHQFGRLLAIGVTATFFLYLFINVAMVMGLLPVVGVPLPLISYGGTAILTIMAGFGLLMSVYIHRDVTVGRQGLAGD